MLGDACCRINFNEFTVIKCRFMFDHTPSDLMQVCAYGCECLHYCLLLLCKFIKHVHFVVLH